MDKIKKPIYKKWWFWVAIVLLLGIIIGGGGKDDTGVPKDNKLAEQHDQDNTQEDTEDTTPEQEEQMEKTEQDDTIKAGMYKAGNDIPSGEYILFSGGSSYYQITKDSTGELESIISNDMFEGTRYVTLQDGQYIELTNATMQTVENAPILQPVDGNYQQGMYKVGRDIEPGEYKVVPDGGDAYIEITKDSLGTINSIVTNDIFTSEKYITIQKGQYITLVDCYIVTG